MGRQAKSTADVRRCSRGNVYPHHRGGSRDKEGLESDTDYYSGIVESIIASFGVVGGRRSASP